MTVLGEDRGDVDSQGFWDLFLTATDLRSQAPRSGLPGVLRNLLEQAVDRLLERV